MKKFISIDTMHFNTKGVINRHDHSSNSENISSKSLTNLESKEFFPFGNQIKVDSSPCTGQGDSSDKQNDQNQIGEGGRHIHNLLNGNVPLRSGVAVSFCQFLNNIL